MIDVLIATRRPDPEMLKAQIDSIRAQRGVEVNIIRREDESGEGACANFAALLGESRADYAAFSDQDDVWLGDKLAREMGKMRELEARYGKGTPLLVFSDAKVVDAELNLLDESLFHRTRIDPRRLLPRQLILQNVANGNTMLMNAALVRKASPIPQEAFMHDHWIMLVASVFGRIGFVEGPTVLYRQHGGNVIGGGKVDAAYYRHRIGQGRAVLRQRLYADVAQAEAFAVRFGDAAPAAFQSMVGLRERPWPCRAASICRHGIFKNGLFRNLGTLCLI